ncbi:MAG TPA: hypothetical protein VN608_05690 [Clostridia bacterium]|nr:hypothetical protein [Clostridia bacterium]
MDLLQKQITHNTFGSGVITKVADDTITVIFADEIGEKRFLYPEAFEHFLVMDEVDMQDAVNHELLIKLKENEEERLKEFEQKREAALKRAEGLAEEKAASKKKPAAKKARKKTEA